MVDPTTQMDGERLLRSIARRAIDLARAGNKAGVIRLRYLARQIYEIMPFAGDRRLVDMTSRTGPDSTADSGRNPPAKH